MKHIVGGVLGAAVLAAGVAVSAANAQPSAPEVPGTLVPPAGNKVYLVTHAVGVQIYRCDAGAGSWMLVAPRANLYGDNGNFVGSHFGGPTWQARDGSYVTGTKKAEASVDAGAIDWLLLEKRTRSVGLGGDRFADTTFIQRVATTGGRAPAPAECDVEGETAEIPYTADYYFWKAA